MTTSDTDKILRKLNKNSELNQEDSKPRIPANSLTLEVLEMIKKGKVCAANRILNSNKRK